MNQIEVSIMGQSYRLACPDGGEERLREAVAQVDREMCSIRDRGKLKARERIAVLAALNLAYAQAEVPTQDSTSRPRPAAGAQGRTVSNDTMPDDSVMAALVARLDQALGEDGQLI